METEHVIHGLAILAGVLMVFGVWAAAKVIKYLADEKNGLVKALVTEREKRLEDKTRHTAELHSCIATLQSVVDVIQKAMENGSPSGET